MQELVAADKSLLAAVAKNQPIEVALQTGGVRGRWASRCGSNGLVHPFDAVFCGRMGQRPVGHAAARSRGLVEPAQRVEQCGNATRIPAVGGRVGDSQPVGFHLGVTTVLQKQQAKARASQPLKGLRTRRKDSRCGEAKTGAKLFGVRLGRMARINVSDLVPEYAGKLRLVAKKRQDAPRELDEAARKGKSVDRGLVDHGECPGKMRPMSGGDEPGADRSDVCLQIRVVVDPHLRANLRIRLTPELYLLLL